MATFTDIVNQSLILLGAMPVNDASTDPSKPCVLVRAVYSMTLDYVLQDIRPVFARKRVVLDADAPTVYPAGYIIAYKYSYTLPPDYISLVRDDSDEVLNVLPNSSWVIENGKLLSDTQSPLSIRYVYRNTDASTYTGAFVYALSILLAARVSGAMLQNEALTANLESRYQQYASKAIYTQSTEIPDLVNSDTPWVLSRNRDGLTIVGI